MPPRRFPIPVLVSLTVLMIGMIIYWQGTPSSKDSPGTPAPAALSTPEPTVPANHAVQGQPVAKEPLPNLDIRLDPAGTREPLLPLEQARALARLKAALPGVTVDFDPITKSPKWIASKSGFLTAAQPEQAAKDADAPIRRFIETHRAVFGHGPENLNSARRVTDYTLDRNGTRKVVWHQQLDGIDIFEAICQANLTSKAELINVGSQLVADPEAAAGAANRAALVAAPLVSVEQALVTAGGNVGERVTEESIRPLGPPAAQPDRRQSFRAAFLSDADARLAWVPMDADTLKLAWDVTLTSLTRAEMYRVLVDAQTGGVLVRQSLTSYISNASYRVFTAESPTPFSPGHPSASSLQPPMVNRVLVATPALDTAASPNGWINDADNLTSGNNADAYTDTNADNTADLPRTSGSPNRVFDFAMDLTKEPSTYKDASVTQLFYWTNFAHDRLYQLGFTEAAGNFQTDNFGRGGLGNDPVNAEAQDGSGTNNANFSTPVDGGRGRMQMFNWTGPAPDRDGSFEAEVVLHEYCHGLSNRLVGGPSVSITALSSRGMGEGWSDFYGLALTAEAADNPHGNWARAGYSRYLTSSWFTENYYYGARRYSYSTDMLKNPHTFRDIDPAQVDWHTTVPRNPTYAATQDATQVHYQGTVWCVTLWDLRANLILKHGFAAGNDRAMFLVAEGMKLGPANPSFIQARDGIIQAALINHPGDLGEVWTAFAKRGMGDGATAPASTTTTGLTESYKVPDSLEISSRSGWNITGNKGGPFAPATRVIALSNDGASAFNWTANTDAAWLSASPASGTLAPGANVTVTLTTQADAEVPGFYSTNVVISNTTSGFNQPIGVRLIVTPPVALEFDLSSNPGWTAGGEWAYGTPAGAGGTAAGGSGNADPATGATGSNVLGVNLAGNHSTALTGPHYLTTAPVNLSARKNTRLRFQRWLNTNALANTRVTVEVSSNGTDWREVFVNPGSAITDNAWTLMDYDISSIADQQSAVQVRWGYQTISSPGAYSGWNIDDVQFLGEPTATFTLDVAAAVSESGAPFAGTLNLNLPQLTNLTVALSSSDPTAATVPAFITLPAGQTTQTFVVTPVGDGHLDGTQRTVLTASANGVASATQSLDVTDDEGAVLTVAAPGTVAEGSLANSGSISIDAPPTRDVQVPLSSNNPALTLPASVVIPSGTTGPVAFSFAAPDNAFAEGNKTVALTASVPGWTPGSATVSVIDDETPTLTVTGPASAREGESSRTFTVTANTLHSSSLTINLTSDDDSELTVPASVSIPVGQLSATFDAAIIDDALLDGAQPAVITASAGGYANGTRNVSITDNDVHHYSFATIASPQKRNKPVAVAITARDLNDVAITNHTGSVNLSSNSAAGAVPFAPTSITGFSNGVAAGFVTFTMAATAATLTATDANGKTGTSNAFDVDPVVHDLFEWSGLPASTSVDAVIAGTATAKDDLGNTVTSYTDATVVEAFMPVFEKTVGSGTSSTTKVYNTASHDSRTQLIYTVAELGATARWIGAVAFSFTTAGGQAMQSFTIRAKHTNLGSFDGATWEQGEWTTVYTTTSQAASTVYCPFNTPFYYNGTQNLMLDISFNNTTASTAGELRYTATSDNRMLSGTSDSAYGDPLAWTAAAGPAPTLSAELPNLSFYVARCFGPVPASPIAFANGIGSVQAFAPSTSGSALWLLATAPSGVASFSPKVTVTGIGSSVGAATVFSDGFESGTLETSWSTAANSGATARTQVTTANTPKTGSYHLTMDTTSSSTGTFARNSPTLTLDLAGRTNVSLEWFAKEFSDDNHAPTLTGPLGTFDSAANYDGVAISPDGVTWVEVSSMQFLSSSYGASATRAFLDPVIQRMGWSYNSAFRLRFSQYDDQAIASDGIAIDDVAVRANPSSAIALSLPATIAEGTVNLPVTVTLPAAAAGNTTITLASNAPARLTISSPVTVLAGQTTANAIISAPQNQYADAGKAVVITASGSGQTTSYNHVRIVDDERPVLAVLLPPSITEGGSSATGTVSISPLASASVPVFFASSSTGDATVTNTVTISAGNPSATFVVTPVNDSLLDGTRTVTITASGDGVTSGTGPIDVLDNESTQLILTPPAPIIEGGSFGVGTVSIAGRRTVPTSVSLTSSDLTEATVAASIVIPAGQMSANFQVFPVEDAAQDGTQTVTLTASAAGLNAGTTSVQVQDNDPNVLEFLPIASPQVRNAAIAVTIKATDDSGVTLAGFNGAAVLSADADGSPLPVTPSGPITFTNGVWTGNVSIGGAATGVVLSATATDGAVGLSNVFDVNPGGAAVGLTFAAIASPQQAATVIPVEVFAADANGIRVNEVTGPVALELVVAASNAVLASANLALANGAAATSFVVPTALPGLFVRATAGALAGQSPPFAVTGPMPLGYPAEEVLFADDFEAAAFKPQWTISGTSTHRTVISTANTPRGARHLVMDSSTGATLARNEATLTLNLSGRTDVALSFWMKEFSDEDHSPASNPFTTGADFDGVAISADGVTWHEVQGLRTANGISSAYQRFTLNLSALASARGLTLNSTFRIRFNHYDDSSVTTDGFAFDDVQVSANAFPPPAGSQTVFHEDFETGVFGPEWDITGTNNHRTIITAAQQPLGDYHLVMDTHTAANSRNEATLTLNLADFADVVLSFWMKENSDEDQAPPANPFTGGADFDGVAVSVDGNTWHEVQALRGAASTNTYQLFTVDLDALLSGLGISYNASFKIRFNHYDNSPWDSGDGFAFDDITVTARPLNALALVLPPSVTEGATATAQVQITTARGVDTVVALSSNRPASIAMPPTVTIPAGAVTSAPFNITILDNAFLTGTLTAQILADTAGVRQGWADLSIIDNDAPASIALTLPGTLAEGGSVAGSVAISPAALSDLLVELTVSPALGLTLPASVVVPAGSTSVDFTLAKPDNAFVHEPTSALLTASVGAATNSKSITLSDNDPPAPLVVTLPATAAESAAPVSGSVGFAAPFLAGADITVSLVSSDPASLIVPATVTISTGQPNAALVATPVNNTLQDGSRIVTVTASAAGIIDGSRDISIEDDESTPRLGVSPASIVVDVPAGEPAVSRVIALGNTGLSNCNWAVTAISTTAGVPSIGLTTNPSSGIISAGGSGSLTAFFDPTGLAEGTYTGVLRFTSNDLVTPQQDIAVTLNVTPAVHHFDWSAIGSPQAANVPFAATVTARTAAGALVSGFNGIANVAAFGVPFETTSGTGTNNNATPFPAFYNQYRTQAIYLPAEVGMAGRIQTLALDVNSIPGTLQNFTVRLKHTAINAYSGAAVWETDGWITVYRGTLVVSSVGWLELPLAPRFDYDGVRNLMVDFTFDNPSTVTSGGAKGTTVNYRCLVAGSWGTNGSPLNWQGTIPAGNSLTNLPNIRFTKRAAVPATPATMTFVNGQWAGNAAVGRAGTGLAFVAEHAAKASVFGESNAFNVTSIGSLGISLNATGTEGDSLNGTVSVGAPLAADLIVSLTSSDTSSATAPASVTIPAGQTSVPVTIALIEDAELDGLKSVSISAVSANYDTATAVVAVADNETTTVAVTLPSTISEGGGTLANGGSVTLGTAPSAALTLALVSSDTTEMIVPASVTIPAGQTSAAFALTPVNDTLVDGDQPVTVTATLAGSTPGSNSMTVTDNESRTLTIALVYSSRTEGSGTTTTAGSVSLSGTAVTPVNVTVTSSDLTELQSTTATIAAGSSIGYFNLTAVNDSLFDGSQTVILTASAASFTDGTGTISITDDDVHNFLVSAVASPQVRNSAFNVTFTARDVNNATISGYAGSPTLSAADGASSLTVTPTTVTGFSSGVKTQSVTLGGFASNAVLTLTDPATGGSGSSNAFAVGTGALSKFAWNTIASPQTAASPFAATLTAQDAAGNTVTSFTGTAALNVPATVNVGSAGGNWGFPFYTYYHDARTQTIYTAAELGAAKSITSLAVEVLTAPGQTMTNLTIRMRHTSKVDYSGTGNAAWESSGWTTCYQANETISTTGWKTFNFTTPFAYDGTQNVMVDISFNNSSFTSSGTVRATSGAATRSISYNTDSGYGDPLTWSGTTSPTPQSSTTRPDVRFGFASSVMVSPATTGAFIAGVWTGNVSVSAPQGGVQLRASSGSAEGVSNAFDVSSSSTLHHFAVSSIPSPIVQGQPQAVTITAQDAANATVYGFAGTVALSASTSGGTTVAVSPGTSANFANGVWTGTISIAQPGSGITVTANDGAGHMGNSNSFNVSGPAASFGISAIPAAVVTGVPISLTLTARDSAGNVDTGFTGSAQLVTRAPGLGQLLLGKGPGATSISLTGGSHDARTQTLYTAAQMGARPMRFTGMAVNVATASATTFNSFTIRLRHSTKTSFSTGGFSWETADWTTVYVANQTFSTTGWMTFPFSVPFDYNGTDSLMIDLSFDNSATGTSASLRSDVAESSMTLLGTSNSTNGQPTTWSGSTPSASGWSLALQVKLLSPGNIDVTPQTAAGFSAGSWTGNVTFTGSGKDVTLTAIDGAGRIGTSNVFAVAPPAIAMNAEPAFTGGTTNGLSWNAAATATGYDVQAAPTATFANPIWSASTAGTSAIADGLSNGTQFYFRSRALTSVAHGADVWSQSEWGEFATDSHSGTTGDVRLGSVTLAAVSIMPVTSTETFDSLSGGAWTPALAVTGGNAGFVFSSSALTAGPNTTPALPINQGGDLEGRVTGTFAWALSPNTAAGYFSDGYVEAYLCAEVPTTNFSGALILRGNESVSGLPSGYWSNLFYSSATTASISISNMAGSLANSSVFSVSTADIIRLRFTAKGPRLTVNAWKVAVSGGVVMETPINLVGSTPDLVAYDTRFTYGRAGMRTSASTTPLLLDNFTTAIDRPTYVATGTVTSPVIAPAVRSQWGLLSFSGDTSAAGTSLTVDVLDSTGNLLASNVTSGSNLNSIPAVASATAIRLRANLATSNTANTPALHAWSVGYEALANQSVTGDWSAVVSSTQDAMPPALSVPPISTTAAGTVLSGTATDSVSGVASVTVAGVNATTSNSFANWNGIVSGLTDGANRITVSASDNAVPPNITSVITTVYRIANPNGDPDNNGIGTLIEHALGIPNGAANPQSMLPVTTVQSDGGTGQRYLTMDYRRRIQRAGIQYVVETSGNLATWDPAGSDVVEQSVTPAGDGVTEIVRVRVTPAIGPGVTKFVRLSVVVQ